MQPVDMKRLQRVRWAVRLTLVLGVAASVIANVLHANPNPISQTIAAWPPLALLLTIELIARVPVHRRALAAVRLVATALIAGIAAWVSYWHMAGVAARYGETGAAPYLIPLSVDGLVVVASVCLVELAGRIRTAEAVKIEVFAPPLVTPAPTDAPAEPEPAELPAELPPTGPEDQQVSAEVEPAEVPREVPPPAEPASEPRNGKIRRPVAETRRLATAMLAGDPTLSRDQIAEVLGVTTRRLRDVLATTSEAA